jgi:hypothetical protein
MPATTTRRITPRQQRYIASLAEARQVSATLAPLVARAAEGELPSTAASSLIDALANAPRRTRPDGTRPATPGEDVGTPNQQTRAGRMLNAGGISATVTLPDGRHVTIDVRTRVRSGRGYANANPTDAGAFTNIRVLGNRIATATVGAAGTWQVRFTTRQEAIRQAVHALFEYAATGTTAGGERVQEASRCGRCLRTLTDPVSIDRGIGPECLGRVTGSRHVPRAAEGITRVVAGEPVDVSLRVQTGRFVEETRHLQEQLESLADAFAAPVDAAATAFSNAISEETRRVAAEHNLTRDQKRARDLIAEALDAYCDDEERDFAMSMFDQLAAR